MHTPQSMDHGNGNERPYSGADCGNLTCKHCRHGQDHFVEGELNTRNPAGGPTSVNAAINRS